jgi:hypothetical protein
LRFPAGDNLAPAIGNAVVDRHYSSLESERQIIAEPFVETPSSMTGRHPLDAVAQFRQCHHADENAILIDV